MRYPSLLHLAFFLVLAASGRAQSIISDDGSTTPVASAALEVRSTTAGVLLPRLTSPQRAAIANPAAGLMVFDTTTGSFWFFDGNAWAELITQDLDQQALTRNGNSLSLTGSSRSVSLGGLIDPDNLGNHTATENLRTNGFYISNDGQNEGFFGGTNQRFGINGIADGAAFTVREPNRGADLVLDIDKADGSVLLDVQDNGRVGLNTTPLSGVLHIKQHGSNTLGDYALQVVTADNDLILGVDGRTGLSFETMHLRNDSDDNSDLCNGLEIIGGSGSSAYNDDHQSSFVQFQNPNRQYSGRIRQDGATSIGYISTSDERLKTNIRPSRYGLHDLLKITVVDYNYRDTPDSVRETGVIAQDVYELFPEPVTVGNEERPWMVDYGLLTPLLVRSVQDQQLIIDGQEARLAELNALLSTLEKRLGQLPELRRRLARLTVPNPTTPTRASTTEDR